MAIYRFQYNQAGAPQLAGQQSTLIAVLNACLVNGFNLKPVVGITRDGAVATVTFDNGHGFREGDQVLIAGANEAAFNGVKRLRGVTATKALFDVGVEAPTQATGTLTAKIAPIGWESPFTGVNKAAYRSVDPSGNRLFLRIDETSVVGDVNYGGGLRSCSAQLWEVLNDIDNGTGRTDVWWRKSQNETAVARPWYLVGDSKRFWLMVSWSETLPGRYVPFFFGDIVSFKPGDAYGTVISGYYAQGYNAGEPQDNEFCDYIYPVGFAVGNTGIWVARNYTQLGASTNAIWVGAPGNSGSGLGATQLPYPNPADNGLYVMPLIVQEKTGPSLRGRLPGMFCPLHPIVISQPTDIDGFMLDGRLRTLSVFNGCQANGGARYALDLTGPWE